MERVMTIEERIKRAEEIYARRQQIPQRQSATVPINKKQNKKDIKLLKKMTIQIMLSLSMYLVIYIIQNNNYIFTEEFIKKINEILSYDINFQQIYENVKQNINLNIEKFKNNNSGIIGIEGNTIVENEIEQNVIEENIVSNTIEERGIENNIQIAETIPEASGQEEVEEAKELTEEEKEIEKIKSITTFIKPVEGAISSKYGQREPTTSTVPKNHTGTDIAADIGTKIVSSTEGEVVLVSEEGDFGKHLKIQIGEVSVIYAHCNNIYVKQGEKVTQGQEIAEVGSTGNSTGPHLHFEIRLYEKTIDPEKILQL